MEKTMLEKELETLEARPEGLFIGHIVKREQKECILKFRWGGEGGTEMWAFHTVITLISPPYKDGKVVSDQVTNVVDTDRMIDIDERWNGAVWAWVRKYLAERR